ncbi:protein GUCD1 isoform X2 [Drosophila navojoa]|uniref:protein GUCD1 isoform X2 n=1 Tax=Drosophila navojoa TaxID=7232 RepID=UPI000846B5C5|nr:protein GUCD1 isoform X2 [Drosophila navojoa]
MTAVPQSKQYNITHIQQRFNWDCGVTCILMILSSSQRKQFLNNFESICKDEGFGVSTWTIDLCYLLLRYHVRHEYYTQTIGVDPSYKKHSYYSHVLDKDEKRVMRRFKEAPGKGLRIQQRTVNMHGIVMHLARHGPIILLTNASQLICEVCRRTIREKFGFAGHYVVLCGYDAEAHTIFYNNPETRDGHTCRCSPASMDTARTAFGTDQDIIFIFEKSKRKK